MAQWVAGHQLWILAATGAFLLLTSCAAMALRGLLSTEKSLAIVYPASFVAAAICAFCHFTALIEGGSLKETVPIGIAVPGIHFRLDALSAFFGLVLNVGIGAASLYGMGLDPEHDLSARAEPYVPMFAVAMNAVLIADDAFSFLFAWEMMSLSSWLLVVSRHRDLTVRFAGYVYLVMAVIGTLALLFSFAALGSSAASLVFDDIRTTQLPPAIAALALAGAFIGAGSKAGIMPLHAWPPFAHPAAPSHVSAMMSGVMTKVAVYGLVRITFDLAGTPAAWWALPFIVLGALSAVGGLLHALMDNDLKRILAYSTIENIGIIFTGLGFALAFKATGAASAAALAMTAALLHVLNHSWFKSLLFLGAGAVLHATGHRDIDRLGGLIKKMPVTAFAMLVGAMAISALPPLNGFVSEWLLFQAVLSGPKLADPMLRFLSPAVGAMIALAAGLAAACFVRLYGTAFLGRPRTPEAAGAQEVPLVQRAALVMLAGLCVAGGILGNWLIQMIGPAVAVTTGTRLRLVDAAPTPLSIVPIDAARSIYDAPTIALFVLIAAVTTTLAVHVISQRRTRRAPPWDCGFPDPSPITQYSGVSFAQPLRRVYGVFAFGARDTVDMPRPGEMRAARLEISMADYLWRWLYAAPAAALMRLSVRLNALQYLTIRRYLVMMFATLIILLVIVAGWM